MNFTEQQQQQIDSLGITESLVEKQIENFKKGFPFLPISEPSKIGKGIIKLSDDELARYVSLYEQASQHRSVLKFVPASGAASRMFKELFAFVERGSNEIGDNEYIAKFINNISSFAFYELLKDSFRKKGKDLNQKLERGEYIDIIEELISSDSLNYGGLPKGLLKFHRYDDEVRTPVEEHFAEGAMYAVGQNKTVNLHFTVAPEHQLLFEEKVEEVQPIYEKKYGVTYHVTYSQQLKSTDTIAVTNNNTPFVEDDGTILFRPAGHGALLANLNALDADIIFIKNIDNVVPDGLKDTTVLYKKAIGGVLLDIQQQMGDYQSELRNSTEKVKEVKSFFEDELFIQLPTDFDSYSQEEQSGYLLKLLNRPVRVCGMVENKGEAGGGPFLVKNSDGSISQQIAETSQLDLEDNAVKQHLKNSSHFNPVDLVCGVKDTNGEAFDLLKHRDDNTGFITNKSKNGKELKAQELPGLWNGAMSNWTTLFVEVPLITFNPVKTVNDLLRTEHQ